MSVQPNAAAPTSGRGARVAQNQQQAAHAQQVAQQRSEAAATSAAGGTGVADDRVWVACNKCDKWRALPSTVDTKSLPELWLCEYNTHDPSHADCSVPEEAYVQPDAQLKVSVFVVCALSPVSLPPCITAFGGDTRRRAHNPQLTPLPPLLSPFPSPPPRSPSSKCGPSAYVWQTRLRPACHPPPSPVVERGDSM